MTWLQILQLALTLTTQALAAFAAGAKKEHAAVVQLPAAQQATLQHLAAPKESP